MGKEITVICLPPLDVSKDSNMLSLGASISSSSLPLVLSSGVVLNSFITLVVAAIKYIT